MFRRDLCVRCFLQETYGTFHGRVSSQFTRNVSHLSNRTRPGATGRGPALRLAKPSPSVAKQPFKQVARVSNVSKLDTRVEQPSRLPSEVQPGAASSSPSNNSTKIYRPGTKRPFEGVADRMSTSESDAVAEGQTVHPEVVQTGDGQTPSTEGDASSSTHKPGSTPTPDDLRAIFDVPEEVKARLKEASQYLEQNYDNKRTRNSILKSSHRPMWQANWRTSFALLRLEYVVGRYIENAPAPDAQRVDHWSRWDREMSPFDVSEPQTLSRGTLRGYVQRILSLQAPPPLHRLLYSRKAVSGDHVSQISAKIASVFQSDRFRPFLTPEAFEDVLRFMFRNNELSNARQLLNAMVENKITIRTSTINLFFGSAAFHSDLRFFTYILKLKQSLLIPSDGHTWARFLRTLLATRVKLNVFEEMERLGLFKDSTALRGCVAEIVVGQLRKSIQSDEPLWAVLERLDARFGHNWASIAAANKICAFFGASGLIDQVPRLLTFMEARNIKPDSQTLSIVIQQAALTGQNQQILNVIKLFKSRYGLMPRAKDFDCIFKAAWDSQSFNTCHILWRLACGFGFVSQRMRHLVYLSLLQNTPQHPATEKERWQIEAGKVVVFSRPEHPRMKAFLGYEADDTYVAGDVRSEYRALATDILRRDRLTRLKGSYHGNWIPLYEAAIRRDQRWTEKDVLSSKPLRWKLQRVMRLGKQQSPRWKVASRTTFYHLAL